MLYFLFRGDYDKCDYLGNSCLHLAAQNGHRNCLTFLIKLGANLYKLDNYYNSALALAGNRGHDECVKYLDSVISKEKQKNLKVNMHKSGTILPETSFRQFLINLFSKLFSNPFMIIFRF